MTACGDDDGGSAASNLAGFMPADAFVYVEGSLKPDEEVADDVEQLSQKLTGSSLSAWISDALEKSSDSSVSLKDDMEPWLGQDAALFVSGDLANQAADAAGAANVSVGVSATVGISDSSNEDVGIVVESTDTDASNEFVDKAAEDGATDGEYEGFSFKISDDDRSVLGVVDEKVVFATNQAVFESMIDASKGDSLEGTSALSELSDKVPDGSLLNVFIANDPIIGAASEGAGGVDLNSLYSALGGDLSETANMISLVPEADGISVVGTTNADPALVSGDASGLIESFPADSVFALGSGDIGANLSTVIDAINEEGIEGLLAPGELKKSIDESTGQGIDVTGIIESLDDLGIFVGGGSVDGLGGALVLSSSDPEPLKNTLGLFQTLLSFSQDVRVQPLKGDATGFRVRTPELPGQPVVVAIKGERLVIAVGLPAAAQALNPPADSLADSAPYKAAEQSLSGENVDMFVNPSAIGDLIAASNGEELGLAEVVSAMKKLDYIVSGSGSEDQTFELNLGLKE